MADVPEKKYKIEDLPGKIDQIVDISVWFTVKGLILSFLAAIWIAVVIGIFAGIKWLLQ